MIRKREQTLHRAHSEVVKTRKELRETSSGPYPGPPSRTSATKFALFRRICNCRGRRSRRQFFVAVALTGRPSFWNLSRSPKRATLFCRGRPYRPPLRATKCRFLSRFAVFFFFTGRNANVTVFVVEQRESFLSLSPISVNYITHKWKWNTFTPPPLHPIQENPDFRTSHGHFKYFKDTFFKTTTGKSLNFT